MKAFELTFSTIAMLVGIMIVLLVVMIFFRGSFEGVGAKFGFISQQAGETVGKETQTGGGLDVGTVLGNIKSKFCTTKEDCASLTDSTTTYTCVDAFRCSADGKYYKTVLACTCAGGTCTAAGKHCCASTTSACK